MECGHVITEQCECYKRSQPAQESITDMEFDRGIWKAVIDNQVERVHQFIMKGKTMERDNYDYTALHYSARNGNLIICDILLKIGKADVNAKTKGGVTPLHRAAMMGHLNIVKLLIEQKANVYLQDSDGQTALHRSICNGHIEISKYLIDHYPQIKNIRDNKNKIPFDYMESSLDKK